MIDRHDKLEWYKSVPAGFGAVVWLTTVVGAWLGGDLHGWVFIVGYFVVAAGSLAAIAIIVVVLRAFRV